MNAASKPGILAKIPGLGAMFMALTRVLPLGRGKVEVRNDTVYVEGHQR